MQGIAHTVSSVTKIKLLDLICCAMLVVNYNDIVAFSSAYISAIPGPEEKKQAFGY